ncbi:MAG: 23S rRNA (adenine(2503)-C(2))-methyltransferase RlmN [Oscillospiraceae bacterium]|nr:23S rRNA (adenine(2503)-C(2))-methyltransferase RlmN [Oscillospiraceae bacterium]
MPNGANKLDIKSMLPQELEADFKDLGLPAWRAKQVFRWLGRGVSSFEEMTDQPKALRATLDERYFIPSLTALQKQVSAQDGTEKLLWRLPDGESVETVFMRYKHGNTVCISSQVGCRMGCAFCASTIGGRIRNLSASEMLDEVLRTGLECGPVSNIVLMGIGEPLDNFDNVLRFLRLVNDPEGANIGMRHISLSTCGLIEGIDKLAALNLQLTLSVSLHGPDDETRSRLMPVNRQYGVDVLYDACRRYFRQTGRRISFEYAMVRDINDTPYHARLLAKRLHGTGAHVNLIRLNYVSERDLLPSTEETVRAFAKELADGGVTVTVRRRLGRDIDAACGQLRRGQMRHL